MNDAPRSLAALIAAIPPTFKHTVALPHPTGAQPVEFEFRTRNTPALEKFVADLKGMSDPQAVAEVAVGWDLADKFTAANIKKLCGLFPGAAHDIVQAYLRALTGIKA